MLLTLPVVARKSEDEREKPGDRNKGRAVRVMPLLSGDTVIFGESQL